MSPLLGVITSYSENRIKPITTFCGQSAELLIVKAGVLIATGF